MVLEPEENPPKARTDEEFVRGLQAAREALAASRLDAIAYLIEEDPEVLRAVVRED